MFCKRCLMAAFGASPHRFPLSILFPIP